MKNMVTPASVKGEKLDVNAGVPEKIEMDQEP